MQPHLQQADRALGAGCEIENDHVGGLERAKFPLDLFAEVGFACFRLPGRVPTRPTRIEDRHIEVAECFHELGLPVRRLAHVDAAGQEHARVRMILRERRGRRNHPGLGRSRPRKDDRERRQQCRQQATHAWFQRFSSAAARAFASTSSIVPVASQLPPTHSTGSNASHSGALASVMPPVGQKRAW